jgi:hypothetical protein
MGHCDFKTTLIYADYQPSAHEAELVQRAFARRSNLRSNLSEKRKPHLTRTRIPKPKQPSLTPLVLVVVQAVAGSSPVAHPPKGPGNRPKDDAGP